VVTTKKTPAAQPRCRATRSPAVTCSVISIRPELTDKGPSQMKNLSRAAVSLIALLIGIGVVFAEVAYYLSHPRVDHSLTLVLFALGVGLALVAWQQSATSKE